MAAPESADAPGLKIVLNLYLDIYLKVIYSS